MADNKLINEGAKGRFIFWLFIGIVLFVGLLIYVYKLNFIDITPV